MAVSLLRALLYRAGRNGPAALVLVGPVYDFSQGKNEIPFLQKTSNKQEC